MSTSQQPLDTLRDIRSMMDRSSRFISLSGWSGVAAGICALAGAWHAQQLLQAEASNGSGLANTPPFAYDKIAGIPVPTDLGHQLLHTALITFFAALVLALFFTWLRSRKTRVPLWGGIARRVMLATTIPMVVGGIYLIQVLHAGSVGLVAPGCLLFYGLALLNASKYTMLEVRYLGYAMLLTGLVSLAFPGYGLYFWAFGFGILHIIYGMVMWWRYEKQPS